MVEKLTLSWRRAASPGKRYLGILSRGALRVLQGSAISGDVQPGEIRVRFCCRDLTRRASRRITFEPGIRVFSQARSSTPRALFVTPAVVFCH